MGRYVIHLKSGDQIEVDDCRVSGEYIGILKSIRANRENEYEPLKNLLYELVQARP